MITYTKRNVRCLALIATILIFVLFQICKQPEKLFISSEVYSKTIPIYLERNNNVISKNLDSSDSKANQTVQANFVQAVLYQTLKNEEAIKIGQDETSKTNSEKENMQVNTMQEEQEEQNEKETPKTQRQVLQENKQNKWRIQIPRLNLDVHIKEGTSASVMLQAVGHFEETSKWKGNVGLAAHNRGYQCNFFQNIKNLKVGDEIIYQTANGKKVYQVQTNKVILETDWSYLEATKDNRITLITCEENRPEYRRCVQAVEIASYIK